jgi:hypothetical protein
LPSVRHASARESVGRSCCPAEYRDLTDAIDSGGQLERELASPPSCETLLMANGYGIPPDIEHQLRARDRRCVYCRKPMKVYPHTKGTPADKATIEHLNHRPPFYWGEGLERSGLEGIAICCGACNSSRSNRPLAAWLASPYCEQRDISLRTVAPIVKRFLRRHPTQHRDP